MEKIYLTKEDISDFKSFMQDKSVILISKKEINNNTHLIYNTDQEFVLPTNLYSEIESKYSNDLIFGKDKTENIVSVEVDDDKLTIYTETASGIKEEIRENTFWLLTNEKLSSKQEELSGDQHFKYIAKFPKLTEFLTAKKKLWDYSNYKISDIKESAMVYNGITYFKGMTVQDVSVLSFDIETDGLKKHRKSEIYLITNTYRNRGNIEKKMFSLEDFNSQKEMLEAWVSWVRKKNPSILLGHNVLFYDIPYILHVAQICGAKISLGRNGSSPKIAKYVSKFRKDGSQSYEYNNIFIYGREIVDTMFLSTKFDVGRNFESYGLKSIIKHLGLEKEGRSFVDAGQIRKYYNNRKNDAEIWNKTKQYAEEDSDDALTLYDIMAPSYFYFTQSVSKTWQGMINSATGSQINNMMVRAYLQEGHSIAKSTELTEKVEGGISFAIPGLYKNLMKIDIKSAYPSQILRFQMHDEKKDPRKHFYNLVHYFTYKRFDLKKLYKETGEQKYKDEDSSAKILINSAYGLCNTPGLNFNSPNLAAKITLETRNVLEDAILYASGKNKDYWFAEFKRKTGIEEEDDNEEL